MPGKIYSRIPAGEAFRLGEWRVEPKLNRIIRDDGTSIQIELRVMDVLACLARRPGQLVSRRQLIESVWATEFVTANTLTHAIAVLRRALGDDARKPTYIETIHRKGYRLIAAVELMGPIDGDEGAGKEPHRIRSEEEARSPYPGLVAFSEQDAACFFGRDAEISQLWRTISSRRLAAVIGSSGVGKTSLLRAGFIPTAPPDWSVAICQPGEAPLRSLGKAIPDETADEAHVLREGSDDLEERIRVWRQRYSDVVVIIDQFEELFTLNSAEIRDRFMQLIGRLTHDDDVHVLLSMRDDFLLRCHEFERLAPLFSALIPIHTPSEEALRRAIVQPAADRGYSFEDNTTVDHMLASVEGERAALPLLAFSLARLWDVRDRGSRLLTASAYSDLGGVSGALARHAETTLRDIGDQHVSIVRVILRNLVTADGTRCSRDLEDLISLFPANRSVLVRGVLANLVDARLLTVFEEQNELTGTGRQRAELAHESLLTSWPRLARWLSEDSEGLRFREELRTAARLWNDHDRHPDHLWSGLPFRRFLMLRDRYAGELSDVEESFATAMVEREKRRTLRQRYFRVGLMSALVTGLAIVAGFWVQSSRQALRAEAAKLVLIGESEEIRSAKLAYAVASLEFHDSEEARELALRTLWDGPPASYIPLPENEIWHRSMVNRSDPAIAAKVAAPWAVSFSPDGRHLAVGFADGAVRIFDNHGAIETQLQGHGAFVFSVIWSSNGELLATSGWDERVMLWSFPSGERLREIAPGGLSAIYLSGDGTRLLTETGRRHEFTTSWKSWPIAGGEPELLGVIDNAVPMPWLADGHSAVDPEGRWAALTPGALEIEIRALDHIEGPALTSGQPQLNQIEEVSVSPRGNRIAFSDDRNYIHVSSLNPTLQSSFPRLLQGCRDVLSLRFNESETQLIAVCDSGSVLLWELDGPVDADPTTLRHRGQAHQAAFDRQGRWIATTSWSDDGIALRPQRWRSYRKLNGHESRITGLGFGGTGAWLASASFDGTVRIWLMSSNVGADNPQRLTVTLPKGRENKFSSIAVSPDGDIIAAGTQSGEVQLLKPKSDLIATRARKDLYSFVEGVAIDPSKRFVAVRGAFDPANNHVTVWDLISNTTRVLDAGDGQSIKDFHFIGADLLTSGDGGLRLWDLASGRFSTIRDGPLGSFDVDSGNRWLVLTTPTGIFVHDLETHHEHQIASQGRSVALDASGEIVVILGGDRGIQVVPRSGGLPQLLPVGRSDIPMSAVVSPDGATIAVGYASGEIRLWPMPDLEGQSFFTVPKEDLITELKTLTNLRAVRDDRSSSGWKLETGSFPGWETVPVW